MKYFVALMFWFVAVAVNAQDKPNIVLVLMDNFGWGEPGETTNVLFPNSWVSQKALPQLTEHIVSFRQYTPITPGTPDPYMPSDKSQ